MGSKSDWETMRHAAALLDQLAIPYEKRVVSAHRTPDLLMEYAAAAEKRGLQVLIAGARRPAHGLAGRFFERLPRRSGGQGGSRGDHRGVRLLAGGLSLRRRRGCRHLRVRNHPGRIAGGHCPDAPGPSLTVSPAYLPPPA